MLLNNIRQLQKKYAIFINSTSQTKYITTNIKKKKNNPGPED